MRATGWAALVFVVMLATGCTDDPQPDQVCTHLCQCAFSTPSTEDECTASCLGFDLPADCMSCIGASSCNQLRDGDCDFICTDPAE